MYMQETGRTSPHTPPAHPVVFKQKSKKFLPKYLNWTETESGIPGLCKSGGYKEISSFFSDQ
jgi:hypothetical protein